MKYKRRTITEALADPSIETKFMDAIPSVGDSVPVDQFSEKSTIPLTDMQYLRSYTNIYNLYQIAVKNPQLQSLMLSAFFIMQGISSSNELDNNSIDEVINALAEKLTTMINTVPATPTADSQSSRR